MTDLTLTTFTKNLLEKGVFSCSICNNLLAIPIMMVQNVGNVCPSCFEVNSKENKWNCLINTSMELILEELKFPCKFKNKGCRVILDFKDVAKHEVECKHSTKVCPMFKICNCNWEGNSLNFGSHFLERHEDYILNTVNDSFFVETCLERSLENSIDLESIKILVTSKEIFILKIKVNSSGTKLLYILCDAAANNSHLEYSVKHRGTDKTYFKRILKVKPANIIYKSFDEADAEHVSVEGLKNVTNISNTINSIFKIIRRETKDEEFDESLLPYFECPVCKNFMKPPIFQCQSGHSVCHVCRPRLEKCPTCRDTFGGTRNFSLEGLTSGIQYPCSYHDLGCREKALAAKISQHEQICAFRPYKCPFPNCSLTGNNKIIIAHLKDFHAEKVFEGNEHQEIMRLENSLYGQVIDRYCFIVFGRIFRMTRKRISEYCLWATDIVGEKNESQNFTYEIGIFDARKPEKKLTRTDYCMQEMPDEELFKKSIMFPNSILSSYSSNGMLSVNYRITQIN